MYELFDSYNSDTTKTIFTNEYYADSTIVKTTAYFYNDSLPQYYEEVYDNKKRLLQSTTYKATQKGKVAESIEKFSYDRKGNKLSSIEQNLIEGGASKTTFEYDPKGNLIKYLGFQNDTLQSQIDYKYKNARKAEALVTSHTEKKKYLIRYFYE